MYAKQETENKCHIRAEENDMDKKIFLSELEKSLSVLQEEELQDIISEYEQHIDLKVKNGLSEEEAIADFGSLAELKAEILEAYHVRADFDTSSKKSMAKKQGIHIGDITKEKGLLQTEYKITGMFVKVGNGLKRAGKMAWEGISMAGKGIWKGLKWGKRQVCRPFIWLMVCLTGTREEEFLEEGKKKPKWFRRKESNQEKRIMERTKENERIEIKRDLSSVGKIFCALGNGVRNGMEWCVSVVVWCFRLGWNVCCVGASLLVGMFGLLCLYGLGILIVLLSQGYPLIGITIGCFGLVLCLFSLTGFGFTLLWHRKKKHAFVDGGESVQNKEENGTGILEMQLEEEGEQHA